MGGISEHKNLCWLVDGVCAAAARAHSETSASQLVFSPLLMLLLSNVFIFCYITLCCKERPLLFSMGLTGVFGGKRTILRALLRIAIHLLRQVSHWPGAHPPSALVASLFTCRFYFDVRLLLIRVTAWIFFSLKEVQVCGEDGLKQLNLVGLQASLSSFQLFQCFSLVQESWDTEEELTCGPLMAPFP